MHKLEKILAKRWIACLLLAFLTFAVWGKSLTFDFVWDDYVLIVRNQSILSLKNIPQIFFTLDAQSAENIGVPLDQKAPSFRPLRTTQYAILQLLGGKKTPQPWIFHLTNLIWHTTAVLLLFSIAQLLFQGFGPGGNSRLAAWLVAAAFAVHPVTSEVVCWNKSLDDIMATVFILAATRSLLKWTGDVRSVIATAAYFALALYSKESSAPFPALAVIIILWRHRLPWRAIAWRTALFFAVFFVFMIHRHFILGRSSQADPISGSYLQTLIDTVPALATYFRLLWGIPPFCIDYTYMPSHRALLSIGVLAGLALMVAWAGLTFWSSRTPKLRPFAIGLLWLGIFLLPVSNLLPMVQYMAERFLYLPLIGWLLALGASLLLFPARVKAPWLLAGLIALWIPVSLTRAEIWRDEVTLFVRSNLQNPPVERIRENAVVAVFKLPHVAAMFSLAKDTHKLGVGSLPPGQGEAIIATLSDAHILLPAEPRITSALGIAYAVTGQLTNALPLLQLATRHSTNDSQTWVDLGSAYGVAQDWPNAHVAYETALRLNPTNIYALRRYTQMCWNLNEKQKALPFLRTLHQLEPANEETSLRLKEAEIRP